MSERLNVRPINRLECEIDSIPGDKSISHRCAMFSLLSDRPSHVRGFLEAEDTLNSLQIAQQLGAEVLREDSGALVITPPSAIKEPVGPLDCGNAGTGIRLYAGLLASQEGFFILDGDQYLRRRPMRRVADPLRSVGAKIDGREEGNYAPLAIRGSRLKGFHYESPVASAQVKSALILAALRADSSSRYHEVELTRDHTERMLRGMGARIENENGEIVIFPLEKPLDPLEITVPADPSSAFFFAVAAAIVPQAHVKLKNILLNKTRIEAFKILEKMGARISYHLHNSDYEEIGDIEVRQAPLQAVEVSENIAWLIDELPALAIAMTHASGVSRVKNAKELRVKESDRIVSVVQNLQRCGVEVEEFEDGYAITGGAMNRAEITSFGDHRIAMSFAIAGLISGMEVIDIDCINTSFPNFLPLLKQLGALD